MSMSSRRAVAMMICLCLAGCNPNATPSENPPVEIQATPTEVVEELTPQETAEMIDYFAGHPDDPRLPGSALGVTDGALLSMDPADIAGFLNDTESFARDGGAPPRSLFALGRAAYLHGYEKRANEYLTEATNLGSAPAWAYLGYQASEKGDFNIAKTHLLRAQQEKFDTLEVRQALEAVKYAVFSAEDFNRPDLIQALYDSDMTVLRRDLKESWYYIGKMQNTLWASDILFIVDDPGIFFELDANVAYRAGSVVKEAEESIFGTIVRLAGAAGIDPERLGIIGEEATQDARRLALLYASNREDFRKVYRGMAAAFKSGGGG